ncbi:MAG: hypothetical protein WCG10_06240 [Chlamydiota bacterium]
MSAIDPIEPLKPTGSHEIIQHLIETPSPANGLHNRLSSIAGKAFLNISNVFYDFQSSERVITGRITPTHNDAKNAHRVNDATKQAIDSLSIHKEELKTSSSLVGRAHLY